MKSLIPAKTLGHGLLLTSAVFLLNANNALGAEAVGDAQMQAKDLLSGTVDGRPRIVESRATASTNDQTSRLDPQEQARQLILGKPNLSVSNGGAVDHRAGDDPQESARRMILGYGAGGTAAPALKHSA